MNKDMSEIAFMVFVALAMFVVGGLSGVVSGVRSHQDLAIEAGVAHWTIDPVTGERSFEWITPEQRKETD